jgi:hypothetical protein
MMNSSIQPKSVVAGLGWFTGAMSAVATALRRFCPFFSLAKYYVVAQPVAGARLLPEKRGKSILVLQIDHDHPLIARLPRPRDEIVRRFAGKALCFLATREDRIIGHLWITQSPYREPVHRCEFAVRPHGRTAWDFDMWIAPEERLGLAFARLWDQCNSYLREQGVTWTCSRVSAFNPASLKAHERLGMRVMHSLFYLGAGPVDLLIADVAPFIALSFSPRTFPVIEVTAPAGH